MNLVRYIYRFFHHYYFKLIERKYLGRLKYIYQKNNSKYLVIVFSAFNPSPSYNYFRTLKNLKTADKLFILDDFGFSGSYYWYDKGSDLPLKLTSGLIETIIDRGGYESIITVGSSKGGTCAIYFGLMFNASHIYAAACQYLIANYLNTEDLRPILKGMIGNTYSEADLQKLNYMMHDHLRQHENANSVIHLLYSPKEHTYNEHIVFLIQDLKEFNIPFVEQVEQFENHGDVGSYFVPYLKHELNIIIKNKI